MPGFRRHGRSQVKCAVTLTHNQFGDIKAQTRDMSETGVFVACSDLPQTIEIGDELAAQMRTECDDVTCANLVVVRVAKDGVGLSYN